MKKLAVRFQKLSLDFKFAAGTSRGVLNKKDSWYIKLFYPEAPEIFGLGECSPLPGLSPELTPDFEKKLAAVCEQINQEGEISGELELDDLPSVDFALETAILDLENGGKRLIAETEFVRGKQSIPINGLIWMADKYEMLKSLQEKLQEGYKCIKIKIGAIDFDDELYLLSEIRKHFSPVEVEIRVDANGAFSYEEALEKLNRLSEYNIHSIEQPIKPGQWKNLAEICRKSPVPVALDEELIGIKSLIGKKMMLKATKPQYLVLKPTLLGGFQAAQEWIELADELKAGWWITSALESNIGLNAISQWASSFNTDMYQGLGTGQLYHNNIPSPLVAEKGFISYDSTKKWDLSQLNF